MINIFYDHPGNFVRPVARSRGSLSIAVPIVSDGADTGSLNPVSMSQQISGQICMRRLFSIRILAGPSMIQDARAPHDVNAQITSY